MRSTDPATIDDHHALPPSQMTAPNDRNPSPRQWTASHRAGTRQEEYSLDRPRAGSPSRSAGNKSPSLPFFYDTIEGPLRSPRPAVRPSEVAWYEVSISCDAGRCSTPLPTFNRRRAGMVGLVLQSIWHPEQWKLRQVPRGLRATIYLVPGNRIRRVARKYFMECVLNE